LWACEARPTANPQLKPSSADQSAGPHEFILDGITVERFVADKLESRARAARAVIDRRSGQIIAKQVRIISKTVEAQSDQADGNLNKDLIRFRGNVRVADGSGRIIRTQSATYDAKNNRLNSKTTVRIEGANFHSVGQSLDADFKKNEIKVSGPVQAHFKEN